MGRGKEIIDLVSEVTCEKEIITRGNPTAFYVAVTNEVKRLGLDKGDRVHMYLTVPQRCPHPRIDGGRDSRLESMDWTIHLIDGLVTELYSKSLESKKDITTDLSLYILSLSETIGHLQKEMNEIRGTQSS